MRNIIEYPVTKREVIDALTDAILELSIKDKAIGCIRAYALQQAKYWIDKHGPDVYSFSAEDQGE